MQEPFKILFYEDGNPIDPRCIRRFICTFSKSYQEVVEGIIEKSERLDYEVFRFNVAKLMTSFKMTRRGAFHGVKVGKDPNGIIDLCWKVIGDELQKLKKYIKKNARGTRSRVLVDLSLEARNHVIQRSSELSEKLLGVTIETGKVSRVGASRILFSILPEIALPVDNLEWKYVFKNKKYREILSIMANEIKKWERKSKIQLEKVDPNPRTTLPAIYNIMAMAARPLTRAKW